MLLVLRGDGMTIAGNCSYLYCSLFTEIRILGKMCYRRSHLYCDPSHAVAVVAVVVVVVAAVVAAEEDSSGSDRGSGTGTRSSGTY